jgi:hypothetical protein
VREGYTDAIKKSIIDYILLEEVEMDRLNIFLRHRAPPFYGHLRPSYHPLNHSSLIKLNRHHLEEKLLKNTQSALKIQAAWL